MSHSPGGHDHGGPRLDWAPPVAQLPPAQGGPYSPADLDDLARQAGTRYLLAAREHVSLDRKDDARPEYDLGLSWELAEAPGQAEFAAARRGGVRLINWLAGRSSGVPLEKKRLMPILRAAAKAGLWNHLQLPADASAREVLIRLNADHPRVAHSLAGMPRLTPPPPGGFAPLPGKPLWSLLATPHLLLPWAARYGVKELRRLRVRGDGSLGRLGDELEYHFVKPREIPPARLERIAEMILAGGRMKPGALRENLHKAFLVNYVLDGPVLVATSAVKRPRAEYVQKVSELTGIDFGPYLERGYIVVRPEYRGLGVGDVLIHEARKRWQGHKTFVVIGADNLAGQEITRRNGGRLLVSYFSQEMNQQIGIWTPAEQEDQEPPRQPPGGQSP